MRMWHPELLPVLPRPQLVSQWRECNTIIGSIVKYGSPRHLLINNMLNYPPSHFYSYTMKVIEEMKNRGYKVQQKTYDTFILKYTSAFGDIPKSVPDEIFPGWFDDMFIIAEIFNLYEKYLGGGFEEQVWRDLLNKVGHKYLDFNTYSKMIDAVPYTKRV